MPLHALADGHEHLLLVVRPAPFGEQARLELEVGFLADELVEHRTVDRLDRRVHGRETGGRVPRRQVHVEGNGDGAALGMGRGDSETLPQQHPGQAALQQLAA